MTKMNHLILFVQLSIKVCIDRAHIYLLPSLSILQYSRLVCCHKMPFEIKCIQKPTQAIWIDNESPCTMRQFLHQSQYLVSVPCKSKNNSYCCSRTYPKDQSLLQVVLNLYFDVKILYSVASFFRFSFCYDWAVH